MYLLPKFLQCSVSTLPVGRVGLYLYLRKIPLKHVNLFTRNSRTSGQIRPKYKVNAKDHPSETYFLRCRLPTLLGTTKLIYLEISNFLNSMVVFDSIDDVFH